jgi:tetratricopeptide (TPR) repeat protein
MSLTATNGPYALDALRRLAQDAASRKALPEALGFTREIATNSAASFGDRIDYLTLLTATHNPDARSWLGVLKREATNSLEVFALGRWLIRTDGPTNTLLWLTSLPLGLQTNQPVPLVITDCQIDVKDWNGLLASVEKQDWGESDVFRLTLESLARRSLGQTDAAQTLWKRARRQSARRLDRLYRLIQITSAWGWEPEREEVLREAVSEFPREKWAVRLLVDQICYQGQTDELERLLSRLNAAEPENVWLKCSLARVLILRKNQLPTAYRLAKEAYDKIPADPMVVATYAYSLFIQGEQDDALAALGRLKPESLNLSWVAACYGVIQARAGDKQAARASLERAQAARLLPEETNLVLQAIAMLPDRRAKF